MKGDSVQLTISREAANALAGLVMHGWYGDTVSEVLISQLSCHYSREGKNYNPEWSGKVIIGKS